MLPFNDNDNDNDNDDTDTNTNNNNMLRQVCVSFCSSPVVDMLLHGDHGSVAAKRRRDRRLRMHWRQEHLTLQVALAAALHHSRDVFPCRTTTLRSEWEREMNFTAPLREFPPNRPPTHPPTTPPQPHPTPPHSPQEPCTQHFFLDDDSVPELGGMRPDRFFEVMPQERDQRRAVVQIVDTPLVVPSLDVLVPQMENQLAEVSRQLDIRIPEQAIEAPKISIFTPVHRIQVRTQGPNCPRSRPHPRGELMALSWQAVQCMSLAAASTVG